MVFKEWAAAIAKTQTYRLVVAMDLLLFQDKMLEIVVPDELEEEVVHCISGRVKKVRLGRR